MAVTAAVSDSEVKIVCSRGHREKLVGRIGYRDEDMAAGPEPQDFAPDDPRRDEDQQVVLRAGATVGGPATTREARPDGGSKARVRCPVPQCRLDLPISWDTLNRRGYARKLRDAGVKQIELSDLAAIFSR